MIQSIRLQNYRSYKDDSFELDGAVNIIVGPNASGKTNLLEALIVGCLGKSYKASDRELINHDEQWARIDVNTSEHTRVIKLQDGEPRALKSFEIDGAKLSRLSTQKQLPFVLFEPNDLLLLHGGPERRRDYIDDLLERLIVPFGKLRRDYRRALYQRNTQLKSAQAHREDLFVWDVRLSEIGGKIAQYRYELLDEITPKLQEVYKTIAGANTKIQTNYKTKGNRDNYGSNMLKALKANISQDIERGFTGFGPHRDDVVVSLDGHEAKEVASRGETRTAVLALKIIELQLFAERTDKQPILLLDDVFSELDGARRKHLTDYLKNHQVFITTTDADIVVQHFMKKCHIIPLNQQP